MRSSFETKRSPQRICSALILASFLLFAAGCGVNLKEFYFGDLFGKGGSSTIDKNAGQLAEEGMQKMREKDYEDALKAFQKIKEQYPYSKYAPLAELKIGDAHFHEKQYSEAALAYEEFSRLHPRNEVIPYVLYQIGMCRFLSFSTIDRDQGETQQAIEAFQRVIQAFPDSEYAQKAKKQLLECQKRIVAHEYYVGEFYFKQKKYVSAKDRLERISRDFPQAIQELGYQEPVAVMLAECQKHAGEDNQKPSVWTRIGF